MTDRTGTLAGGLPVSCIFKAIAMRIPLGLSLALFAIGWLSPVQGQEPVTGPTATTAESESWYHGSSPLPAPKPIDFVQAKAQARAQQRMARMASLEWYGFSKARPQSSGTPFTYAYGSSWQMPGGRPYAWVPYGGTTVLVLR